MYNFLKNVMKDVKEVLADIKDYCKEKRFMLFVIRLRWRNYYTFDICGSWKDGKGIVKIDIGYDMTEFKMLIGYKFKQLDDKSGIITKRFSKISYEVRRVMMWR